MTTAFVCATCGRAGADGQTCTCCPQCGGPKSVSALRCYACAWPGRVRHVPSRPVPVEAPAARDFTRQRQIGFRVYCFACGRATETRVAPPRLAPCEFCGGSMLVEPGD